MIIIIIIIMNTSSFIVKQEAGIISFNGGN